MRSASPFRLSWPLAQTYAQFFRALRKLQANRTALLITKASMTQLHGVLHSAAPSRLG